MSDFYLLCISPRTNRALGWELIELVIVLVIMVSLAAYCRTLNIVTLTRVQDFGYIGSPFALGKVLEYV